MKLLDILFESVVDMEEGRKPMTKDEFVRRSKEVHDNYYSYDNVVYIGSDKKVMITCPKHGDFPQTPAHHLNGKGCRNCYFDSKLSNTEDFIKKAQEIHFSYDDDGDKIPKYTYDNVVYIASDKKVNITCPIHSPKLGDFPQSPSSHLQGNGCPWCRESKGEKVIKQILFEKNINCTPFKKYDDCISYKSKNGLIKQCYKLEFDFYLPENNTLVEYDGEYHFSKRKNVSLEKYINGVFNDREKNDYTKAKNIKFIRIGYLDKENIEEELMKGLDSKEQLYLSTKYPIDKGWRDTTIKV